ncbi:MAG: AmmeMemoRadiSam system radical SAM enzyme [Candidatus Omnitrophica bacterium]|nr:AmmeMemoRadiSam system radical SAM enzyme [Candidatus Omnitrophota bacterium]
MKKEAFLYKRLEDGLVECLLCRHRCRIKESKYGFCGVRQNEGSKLYTHAYGKVIANNLDPIEKKPLYHFFPGSTAYSVATLGCNFRCGFCQNWQISQGAKGRAEGFELMPDDIVREARAQGARSISYTYTEPTIFFEYAYDTARLAKAKGLYNNFVTNGYMSREALDKIRPYLDAANVDLKAFNEKTYADVCKGHLEAVLDSIRYMKEIGIWIEVTTLVVPGLNDSDEELKDIAGFIAEAGVEIPWHISRFHPGYKYVNLEATPLPTLKKAWQFGKDAGLRYIYLGNVGEIANTLCYNCGELLITRDYLYTSDSKLDGNKCPKCSTVLDGVF